MESLSNPLNNYMEVRKALNLPPTATTAEVNIARNARDYMEVRKSLGLSANATTAEVNIARNARN